MLDFFVFKSVPLRDKVTCDILGRRKDHIPISLNIYATPVLIKKPPNLTNNRTDWKTFSNLLSKKVDNSGTINSTAQLELESEQLVHQIQCAAKASTPVIITGTKPFKLPKELLDLIREKRSAQNTAEVTKFPPDKARFNRLNSEVQRRISQFRNEKFTEFVSKLGAREKDDYTLWKATKNLKRPAQISFPIQKQDGSFATSSQDKADTLAIHFEKVFQPHDCEDPEKLIELEQANEIVNKLPDKKIADFSEEEIFAEIKYKTKIKKNPGLRSDFRYYFKTSPSCGYH